MKKYRVEVVSRVMLHIEANNEDEACKIALKQTKSGGFAPLFEIADEGVEEIEEE